MRALMLVLLLNACVAQGIDTDPLSHLPKYDEQRRALCDRPRANAITDAFCTAEAPRISSLRDVQDLIGLDFDHFSMTANSTGLSARSVSAINPRAVIVQFPDERDDNNFMSLAFARGDGTVELAVRPPSGDTALYLLRYEQDCEPDCAFEDRLTPKTESGWTRWSLYDDVDLKNTVFDCLVCHQPRGPGTRVEFRMQELQNPWTHWIAAFGVGEMELFEDYARAHSLEEDYGGIPAERMRLSNPIDIENFVLQSGSVEPNPFQSQRIEDEVAASSPGQPYDNSVPGTSPTWEALYDRAVRGEVFPPPYHDVKITDPEKLATMTAAYVAWREGTLDGPLPDIRDVIREDAYPALSFRPKPGLNGKQILVHMCAQCHNGRLDQTLSRARFDATNLDAMPRDVKRRAIERLRLPVEDRYHMPPHFLRELSHEEIEACVRELSR